MKLSTVTFSQSVPLRTEGEREVMKDTIQTYYDMTEPQIKALTAKFPGTHFSIERQLRHLGRLPQIETSESFRAMKRYPQMTREEREKFTGVATKKITAQAPDKAASGVAESISKTKTADYGMLVNEMMKTGS